MPVSVRRGASAFDVPVFRRGRRFGELRFALRGGFSAGITRRCRRSVGDRFRSKIAGKHECPVQKSRFSGVPEQQAPQGIRKTKTTPFGVVFVSDLWELRDSNPRPSACKADALNQLS